MWLEQLARFGCAAKGLVYFIIGLLSLQVAFGMSSQTTDTKGALQAIAVQPFGKFLLSFVAVGLAGYALWRLLEAIVDPEHSQQEVASILPRIGYAISGLSYASLAFSATQIIFDVRNPSGDLTKGWTAKLLMQPFGQWLVTIVGIIVISVGLSYLYRAFHKKFREQFNLNWVDSASGIWAMHIGRFGIAARGFVFILIGFFLVQAARQFNPQEARGLDEALQALAVQPQGKFLLGLVALGFIAYSIHMLVEARYRRLRWLRKTLKDSPFP